MALVFQPHDMEWVSAPSHSPTHEYRIAFGYEVWDPSKPPVPCIKVQMANNRKVLGRQAPSYTTQKERNEVHAAEERLFQRYANLIPEK